jgi:hypothetical protein
MRPSHFGSFVAALAVGLALAAAGGVSYLASAPTIPARDVARPGTQGGGSGGAIFFVVDNNHGTLTVKDSTGGTSRSGR